MLEIPTLVQRIAFPIVVAIGKLLGKYEKFKNAAEPISNNRRHAATT